MNPYRQFVSDFVALLHKGESLPLGEIEPHGKHGSNPKGRVALIFSPHPDDECIIGALPLRLMREAGMRMVNIAVTLGSNPARRSGRWLELRKACEWIGFELESVAPEGLERINPAARAQTPELWAVSVQKIADKLIEHRPNLIFLPHAQDSNSTHIGTHFLVVDALKTLPADFECSVIETEFWGQMSQPNLMVESNGEDVADLISALSFHVEEMRRNPYHIGLPAWMRDNVRRGAELVGAQGGAAPDFLFATLYRVSRWKNGALQPAFEGGRQIGVKDKLSLIGIY